MTHICECGCGQEIIPKPKHKYRQPRYLPGHQLKAARDAYAVIAEQRRPEPFLCACGCGQPAPMTGRRRFKWIQGHQFRGKTMEKSGRWKGGRVINNHGYVMLYMPDHHLATGAGYVAEHRLVWEEANGRRLQPGEDVHHINEDRQDNRPENLVALTKTQHAMEHRYWEQNTQTHEDRVANGRKGNVARWAKHPPES